MKFEARIWVAVLFAKIEDFIKKSVLLWSKMNSLQIVQWLFIETLSLCPTSLAARRYRSAAYKLCLALEQSNLFVFRRLTQALEKLRQAPWSSKQMTGTWYPPLNSLCCERRSTNFQIRYDTIRKIKGMCFDTTTSNTGQKAGMWTLVEKRLGRNLLHQAGRHYVMLIAAEKAFSVMKLLLRLVQTF